MKILNGMPRRYFGLHMGEGVAEYRPAGQKPYRILVKNEAIRNMGRTFEGRPVYVEHVDEVDVNEIGKDQDQRKTNRKEDGYVVKSFFNQADGRHWVEFLVVTDQGNEAIRKGWKLSNAYLPKNETMRGGGQWHGVDYQKEVIDGEYEHLAIVRDPRYAESIILTPEEFKTYNENHQAEIGRLANSKEEVKIKKENSMFKFFKRERLENSSDLEQTMVELPKSGKQMTVANALEKLDGILKNGYHCNGDETVKIGEGYMSVNEMVSKYSEMSEAMAKKNAEEEEMKNKKNSETEDKKKENEKVEEEKKNSEVTDEEKKKNTEEEEKKKKENEGVMEEAEKNSLEYFRRLHNAKGGSQLSKPTEGVGEMMSTQVARGMDRYGSGN